MRLRSTTVKVFRLVQLTEQSPQFKKFITCSFKYSITFDTVVNVSSSRGKGRHSFLARFTAGLAFLVLVAAFITCFTLGTVLITQ